MEILLEIFALISTLFKAAGSYFALLLANRCIETAISRGGLFLFLYIPGFLFVAVAAATLILCGIEFVTLCELYCYGEDPGESSNGGSDLDN